MMTLTATAATTTATAFLSLMKIKKLGRRKALSIVDRPIEEDDLACGLEALEARVSRSKAVRVHSAELREAWANSLEQLERGRSYGIQAVSFHDEGYPVRLRDVPDPPAVLFVKGNPEGLHAAASLAVVGTREPTEFGEIAARSSARIGAGLGFAIVSGLAHGCDTLAHEGCLEALGVGVAVLAHGLDMVYPAANRNLAERLLDMGGCLTSEYPFGAKPIPRAFAERDRIQSGLSDAVLVIETGIRGGTMHTVDFAFKQKRNLACIAHTEKYLENEKTKGNQKLINTGTAAPIPSDKDLVNYLDRFLPSVQRDTPQENFPDERQLSLGL